MGKKKVDSSPALPCWLCGEGTEKREVLVWGGIFEKLDWCYRCEAGHVAGDPPTETEVLV